MTTDSVDNNIYALKSSLQCGFVGVIEDHRFDFTRSGTSSLLDGIGLFGRDDLQFFKVTALHGIDKDSVDALAKPPVWTCTRDGLTLLAHDDGRELTDVRDDRSGRHGVFYLGDVRWKCLAGPI